MKLSHQNLCDHADDEQSLYKLWDADLGKYSRRRQWLEFVGWSMLLSAYYTFRSGQQDLTFLCVAAAGVFLFCSIKYMIDESNINYLMHQWDLTDAIARVRSEERRQLNREI